MKVTTMILTGILFFILLNSNEVAGIDDRNKCSSLSCDECMLEGPNCAWCADPDFKGHEEERCQNMRSFKRSKTCNKKQLMVTNSAANLQENEIEENLVSISKVTVNLRQGSRVSFPVTVMVPRNSRRRKENVMIVGWRSGKKPVELHIESDCKNGKTKGHKFVCKKVKKNQQVTFELTMHLKACQAKLRSGKYKIIVKIGKAKKIIQVKVLYVCRCKLIANKKKCSYISKRNVLAGNCVVDSTLVVPPEEIPFPGKPQITDKNLCMLSPDASELLCRKVNSTNICSGNGRCECGACVCDNLHFGKFCECSDHTCPRFEGFLCGGPRRGKCECGSCNCAAGHNGANCGCPTTNATCLASDGGLCNKRGFCICGKCKCEQGYSGATCEDCPTCPLSCDRFKQCAECLATVGHTMPRSMCRAVCNGDVPSFSLTDKLLGKGDKKICYYVANDGCPLNFEILQEPLRKGIAYELLIERRTDCRTSQKCRSDDHCIADNGDMCNGRGDCNCGYCKCHSGYAGSTCEQCTDCDDVCIKYRDCISCVVFQTGLLSPTQCDQECSAIRSGIKLETSIPKGVGKKCHHIKDPSDDCIMNFLVDYDNEGQPKISVLNQRVCRAMKFPQTADNEAEGPMFSK